MKHTLAILFSLFVLFFVFVSGCVEINDDVNISSCEQYCTDKGFQNGKCISCSGLITVNNPAECESPNFFSNTTERKICLGDRWQIKDTTAHGCYCSNNTQIANPASEYCVNNGGTLEIVSDENSQYGICTIGEIQCEEWAFFRGECPSRYDVTEMTNVTCERDYECETPMDYLVRSNCPYTSKCINQTCAVICPKFVNEQYLDVVEHECLPEQRGEVACTMDYNPVCGWFNQSIQCIRYPCAATYGNACTACADEKVVYWVKGECPE